MTTKIRMDLTERDEKIKAFQQEIKIKDMYSLPNQLMVEDCGYRSISEMQGLIYDHIKFIGDYTTLYKDERYKPIGFFDGCPNSIRTTFKIEVTDLGGEDDIRWMLAERYYKKNNSFSTVNLYVLDWDDPRRLFIITYAYSEILNKWS